MRPIIVSRLVRLTSLLVPAGAIAAAGAQSPQVRGTIVERAGRRPIPGAVVSVLDTAGVALARNIADENGIYTVPLGPGAARLRVIRIGFRPNEVTIPAVTEGIAHLDVSLEMIPTFLEPATVRALQCPKRADAEQAYGLWEQARAGLLAGLVARQQKPPAVVRITYRRLLAGGVYVAAQAVVVDSVDGVARPYRSPRDASTFLRLGFADDSGGRRFYSGPDAEVLLDPSFGNGYCFRLADRDRRRPTDVGLAFAPADHRAGRIDIDGVLWVDTVARAIRDIQFTYMDDGYRLSAGGSVNFQDMPNGVSFLDRWRLTFPDSRFITTPGRGRSPPTREPAFAAVSGGEIAHATWSDSTRFDARLGSLSLRVRRFGGEPASGTRVFLAGTSYSAVVDFEGMATFSDLLPGEYELASREPRLAPLHIDSLSTTFTFQAARDSVAHGAITVPTLEEWVLMRCRGGKAPPRGRVTTARTMVLARVLAAPEQPVEGVDYVLEVASPASRTGWAQVARGRTGNDGIFQVCTSETEPGQRIGITLRRGRETLGRLEQNLDTASLTVIPLILKR